MLVKNGRPIERRCPRSWGLCVLLAGILFLGVVSTFGESKQPGAEQSGASNAPNLEYSRTEDSAMKQTSVATPGETTEAEQTGFRVHLSDDVSLELIGVSSGDPKSWWKPDGSPLPSPPYDKLGSGVGRGYEFAIKINGLKNARLWSLEGPDGSTADGPRIPESLGDQEDTRLRGFVISPASPDQRAVEFRLSVAAGPWQAIEGWRFRSFDLANGRWLDNAPVDAPMLVSKSGVLMTPPRQENRGTPGRQPRTFVNHPSVVVELTDTLGDKASRLVAKDKEGAVHTGQAQTIGRGKGLQQRRFRFEGLTLDTLVELRFEASDCQTVQFENVSLRPGHRTEVNISVITPTRDIRRLADLGYATESAASASSRRDRGNDETIDSASDRDIGKNSLRYDGRTFDEWRRELLIELKTERRVEALNALAAFAPHGFARETAEAVLEAKGREDFFSHNRNKDSFRSRTVSVFAGLDTIKVLPVLLETLRTGKSNDRAFACCVLSYLWGNAGGPELLRSQKPIADALVGSSQDGDHRVRVVSLETARMIAPSSDALFQRLRKALHDEHPDVILVAASHGELVRPDSAPDWFVPECLGLTRHKNAIVRHRAVDLLAASVMGIPENAEKVMPRLIEILDESGDLRIHACIAIAAIGSPAKKAVPALIGLLKDSKETRERLEAATALENIGPDAKEAVSVLEPLVQGHQREMDALKPTPFGGKADLWYRAARALRAIQDPYWFRQMRKLRSRGGAGGYGGGMGDYDGGYEMGEEQGMYESGFGGPYGSGGADGDEGGYPGMPGGGGYDGGGAAVPR